MEHYAQNAMRAALDSSATMKREIIDGAANFAILKRLNTRRLILSFGGKRLEPKGTLWDRNFYPTRWKQLRETILERDKNQCRFDGCPSIFNLDVHHINGNEFDMGEANLITLCDQHHAETQARLRKGWK